MLGNIILGIVLLIILGISYNGYRRGFIKTVFSVVVVVVSILSASIFGSIVGKWLVDNESVYNTVDKQVQQFLEIQMKQYEENVTEEEKEALKQIQQLWTTNLEQLQKGTLVKETIDEENNVTTESVDLDELKKEALQWIDKVQIPKSAKEQLIKEFDKLSADSESVMDSLKEKSIQDIIAENITASLLYTLGDIIVFVTMFVVLKILSAVVNAISRLPVLYNVNKVAGLAAGFVEAILTLWILGTVIYMISSTQIGEMILEIIYSNTWLTWLYENNMFI